MLASPPTARRRRSPLRFSKWHALGNAYLVLERAELGQPLDARLATSLCDVRTGVGADGVLEVVAVDGARAALVIWNPDGSTAELSGNGTRIAARWLASRAGVDAVEIAVGARTVRARLRGEEVEQDLGAVEVGEPELLRVAGEEVEVTPVSVGNPHAVVWREPTRGDLLRLGPAIETDPRFPSRTNVQLARTDGPHRLTVLVWERGAGETASSGTSAAATAAAAVARGCCRSPVTVALPGGDVLVELVAGRARLTGPAVEICTGELAGDLARAIRSRSRAPAAPGSG